MERLSVVELRQSLADCLNRAEYRGERIIIHRREKDAAAIVPIEDLRLLERLVREEEDRIDDAAAQAAAEEPGDPVPLDAVRRKLGLHIDEPRDKAVPGRDEGHRGAGPRKVAKKGP
jgi:prevent-host-death family protein